MIHAMSDIHGGYGRYASMLEKIGFPDADALFVLGGAVDSGPEPVRLLMDMVARTNVQLLKGNREAMASCTLRRLNVEITAENAGTHPEAQLMRAILEWRRRCDAGVPRAASGGAGDLLDYIDDAPPSPFWVGYRPRRSMGGYFPESCAGFFLELLPIYIPVM